MVAGIPLAVEDDTNGYWIDFEEREFGKLSFNRDTKEVISYTLLYPFPISSIKLYGMLMRNSQRNAFKKMRFCFEASNDVQRKVLKRIKEA